MQRMQELLGTTSFRFLSMVYTVLYIVMSLVLLYVIIRKIFLDRKFGPYHELTERKKVTTEKATAILTMFPAILAFIMNTYVQYLAFVRHGSGKGFFAILDMLFILTAFLVYFNSPVKWSTYAICAIQLMTYGRQVGNYISTTDFDRRIIFYRSTAAFVYYAIVVCVFIRLMYPHLFVRMKKVARL